MQVLSKVLQKFFSCPVISRNFTQKNVNSSSAFHFSILSSSFTSRFAYLSDLLTAFLRFLSSWEGRRRSSKSELRNLHGAVSSLG